MKIFSYTFLLWVFTGLILAAIFFIERADYTNPMIHYLFYLGWILFFSFPAVLVKVMILIFTKNKWVLLLCSNVLVIMTSIFLIYQLDSFSRFTKVTLIIFLICATVVSALTLLLHKVLKI